MVIVAQCLGLRVREIVGLQWGDFDFDEFTVLVQRSVVHGRVDELKTEYSKDYVPLESPTCGNPLGMAGTNTVQWEQPIVWLTNPATEKPNDQEEIQRNT